MVPMTARIQTPVAASKGGRSATRLSGTCSPLRTLEEVPPQAQQVTSFEIFNAGQAPPNSDGWQEWHLVRFPLYARTHTRMWAGYGKSCHLRHPRRPR